MQLALANHDQSKSWVPYNASAFGTKSYYLGLTNAC